MSTENEENTQENIPKKKAPTPHHLRSPGRPKGAKNSLVRKPYIKFNARKQKEFLRHYAKTGSVSAAADMANISRNTVYAEKKKNPAFLADFERVEERLAGGLEETIYRRVVEGENTVERDEEGNVVRTVNKPCSPKLALDVASRYSDRYKKDKNELTVNVEGSEALVKLAGALGLSVEPEQIVEAQRKLQERDIEGEVVR